MFYRVILDCRPSGAATSQPFISIKFVEAATEGEARLIAITRTKALMKEKGFRQAEIGLFEFTTDELEPFDRDGAEFGAEQSLIYYSDD